MALFVVRLVVRAVLCRCRALARSTVRSVCVDQTDAVIRAATVVHLTRTVEQRTIVGDGRQTVHAMIAEDRDVNRRQTVAIVVHRFNALTGNRNKTTIWLLLVLNNSTPATHAHLVQSVQKNCDSVIAKPNGYDKFAATVYTCFRYVSTHSSFFVPAST